MSRSSFRVCAVLALTALFATATPGFATVIGYALDAGVAPDARTLNLATNQGLILSPYASTFTGGVRVALADINHDGAPDLITTPGPGVASTVSVFDGRTGAALQNFPTFTSTFTGGSYVAANSQQIIVGVGPGATPVINTYSATTFALASSFPAFTPTFTGGVRVATGDVNGDGIPDILAASGPGKTIEVKVFSGADNSVLYDLTPFAADTTGAFVAAGDINGDGHADIILGSDQSASPEVRILSGLDGSTLSSFPVFGGRFTGGVRVASADLTGDGLDDLLVGEGPGADGVFFYNPRTGQLLSSATPFGTGASGAFVAAANVPEPAAVTFLSLAALTLLRRR